MKFSMHGGIFKAALDNALESQWLVGPNLRYTQSRAKGDKVAAEFAHFKTTSQDLGYLNDFINCSRPLTQVSKDGKQTDVSVWEHGDKVSSYLLITSLPLDELRRLAKIEKERGSISKVTKRGKIVSTTDQRL